MTANESLSNPQPRDQQSRWPLHYAWITSWIYPATTARKTAHVARWKAWLFHVFTLMMILMTIAVIVATADGNTISVEATFDRLFSFLNDLIHEFQAHTFQVLSIFFFSFLGIETLFLLLAFFTMAWGARDESIKASFRSALKRVWICTANLLPALIIVATMALALNNLSDSQNKPTFNWPTRPAPFTVTSSDPNFVKLDAEYKAAIAQFNLDSQKASKQWQAWRKSLPWYVKNPEFIIVILSAIAWMWFIWALLRSVGARRDVPPMDRPPLCEYCGYNLTTMPMESRCPECGETIVKSLGPDVRRGVAWEQQGKSTRWSAWKECFVEPILRSKEFGRKLQVTQSVTVHRNYLFRNLPIIFAIGMLSMLSGFVIDQGINGLWIEMPEFFFVTAMFGFACVIGSVVVTLFGGWLIGWAHSVKHKRNLMPVAIQASCYLSGFLILWAIFGAMNALFVYLGYEFRIFHNIRDVTGMYVDTIAQLSWFVPNVTFGVYYLLLIARTTSGAWYANR